MKHAVASYRTAGLSVIPLRGDKRPWLDSWKPYQSRHATDEECASWWGPAPGVGIVTGRISRIAVLDIDPRHGGVESTRAVLAEGFALPKGPVCDTGGGGFHLYFAVPEGVTIAMRPGMRPGLDLKGEGGYVVAPPSPHPSGNLYTWRKGRGITDLPMPPCPEWLVNGISATPKPFTPSILPSVLPEETRNANLFRMAASMRAKGCEVPEIVAALDTLNQSRCKPPLPMRDIETIARSAGKYPVSPEHASGALW